MNATGLFLMLSSGILAITFYLNDCEVNINFWKFFILCELCLLLLVVGDTLIQTGV